MRRGQDIAQGSAGFAQYIVGVRGNERALAARGQSYVILGWQRGSGGWNADVRAKLRGAARGGHRSVRADTGGPFHP